MTLKNGHAPKGYVGLQAEAYELAADRAYTHVNFALSYNTGDADERKGPPRYLAHEEPAWNEGWRAGAQDARRAHKD